jgi:prophage antirepressor-like protein
MDAAGTPWWVLVDVCRVLGLRNPTEQARLLADSDKILKKVEGVKGLPLLILGARVADTSL